MSQTAISPLSRWKLFADATAQREPFAKSLGIGNLAAQILINRDITDLSSAKSHLTSGLNTLPDPAQLPDFAEAMAVMDEVIEQRQTILIHGDYDVDGTCGSVLLHHLFKLLDLQVEVFIPDREGDGYSFSENSFKAIEIADAKLVVAVDNGTTAYEPLARLRKLGVKSIILDHHPPGETRPDCDALLNPWTTQNQEQPLFPWFCGAGVAWLFAWGLLRHVHGEGKLPETHRRFLMDATGLAAIATVADSMKLIGPNRPLVKHGLATLPNSSLAGLKALTHALGFQKKTPTATDIGFRLAPHLNAAGRMNQAALAFQVLSTWDQREGEQLADRLKELNRQRQIVQAEEFAALLPEAEAQREAGDKIIFVGRPESQFGVLGVVAAKIHEATGLPALLWAECSPGVARGSARGPAGSHLVKLMDGAKEHFVGYGGHAAAAGFHFDPDNLAALHQALRQSAEQFPEPPPPTLDIDCEVQPQEITLKVMADLATLEPFGNGFARPLFLATDMKVQASPRLMTEGRHAALDLSKHGTGVRAVGFNMGERLQDLQAGDLCDVVFEPMVNDFRGRRSVEWRIQDFKTTQQC